MARTIQPKKRKMPKTSARQSKQQKLLKKALAQPGIKEALELQAACERATMAANSLLYPDERTTVSATSDSCG
jgi:hypothetical protein